MTQHTSGPTLGRSEMTLNALEIDFEVFDFCSSFLSKTCYFEVTEAEKATSSDLNATNSPVQHTYGEDSGKR